MLTAPGSRKGSFPRLLEAFVVTVCLTPPVLSAAVEGALPRPAPGVPFAGGGLLRKLALWTGGLSLLGSGLVLVWVKASRARRGQRGGEGIEVVGRTALSHRHLVFVLRVSGRRLVVGVSGDRMTPLGAFEDSPAEKPMPAPPPAPAPASASVPAQGFSSRLEGSSFPLARSAVEDADLAPYRKQMNRLRGLLRGMRGDLDGDEPASFPSRDRGESTREVWRP
ncbi:MAG TPA: flagellar biosynthetic protein FliO [Planctomycetota bacterium]|nr:flagellar biosynthetic protein FliO [Planctomycetota bacterium]